MKLMDRLRRTVRRWLMALAVVIALCLIRDEIAGYIVLLCLIMLGCAVVARAAAQKESRPRW